MRLSEINWGNWEGFWEDPSFQLQAGILTCLIVLAFILTKLTKPLFLSFAANSEKR